jgi:hypothetical protein
VQGSSQSYFHRRSATDQDYRRMVCAGEHWKSMADKYQQLAAEIAAGRTERGEGV